MTQPATSQVSSPDPLASESPSSLGPLQREFRLAFSETMKVYLLVPLLFLAAVGALTLPLWLPDASAFMVVLGPVGLLVMGVSAYHLMRWRKARDLLLRFHEHGLFHQHNGQTHAYPWEQVALFQFKSRSHEVNNIPAGTTYTLSLTMVDGVTLRFSEQLQDIQEVAWYLDQKILALRLPPALEDFKQGQPVKFGPVTVLPGGLDYDGEQLPWREFESVSDEDHQSIAIRKKGKLLVWARIPYVLIPNATVFVTLVQRVSVGQ